MAEIPNISSLDISDNSEEHSSGFGTLTMAAVLTLMVACSVSLRSGHGPDHPAGLAGQEPLHQTPVTGQELQQHQVQVGHTHSIPALPKTRHSSIVFIELIEFLTALLLPLFPRNVSQILDNLVHMLQEEDSVSSLCLPSVPLATRH